MAATDETISDSLSQNPFYHILLRVQQQTPEEGRLSLIQAGIITESGELTEHYKIKPKRRRASKPRDPKSKAPARTDDQRLLNRLAHSFK